MFSTDSRSQVGIGTLVVYITMIVLTAAASGVLISTAASLQAQAHQAGTGSTAPTTDNVAPTTAVGHVETITTEYDSGRATVRDTDQFVTEIRVNVTGTAGTDSVDLTDAVVIYDVGGDSRFVVHQSKARSATINASTNTYAGQGNAGFLVDAVDATTPNNALLTDENDTYQLIIPLGIAYDVDAKASSEVKVGAKNWGDNPADVAAIETDKLFTDVDADDATSLPYTLTDAATPSLPGSTVDQVSFDNTYLNPLPEGERVQIDVVTANDSEGTIVAGPATELADHDGDIAL